MALESILGENETIEEEDDGIEVESVEAGGSALEVKDKHGRTWAIPIDQNEDYDDLFAEEKGIDIPGFWTQTIRIDQIDEYLAKDFAIVTRDEVDLPPQDRRDYGLPVANALTKGPDVYVKIPQKLKDLLDKKRFKKVKNELAELEPTEKMIRESKEAGFPVQVNYTRVNHGAEEDKMRSRMKRQDGEY